MNPQMREILVHDLLERWAQLEYGRAFKDVYYKSKGAEREFRNLQMLVANLIYDVEEITKRTINSKKVEN